MVKISNPDLPSSDDDPTPPLLNLPRPATLRRFPDILIGETDSGIIGVVKEEQQSVPVPEPVPEPAPVNSTDFPLLGDVHGNKPPEKAALSEKEIRTRKILLGILGILLLILFIVYGYSFFA
ncbi:hypothetical protein FACS189419_01360 [Planctomycetales bacterium]|nr:hypothetical protein FACS189419_01360 [Planctomycetales bacterium]